MSERIQGMLWASMNLGQAVPLSLTEDETLMQESLENV